MRKIAVVLFALAVMCVSGEPSAGKQSGTKALGFVEDKDSWGKIRKSERFEVYEDWDHGYVVYKQVNFIRNEGEGKSDIVSISITAAPIRTDWPPKQSAEKGDGK